MTPPHDPPQRGARLLPEAPQPLETAPSIPRSPGRGRRRPMPAIHPNSQHGSSYVGLEVPDEGASPSSGIGTMGSTVGTNSLPAHKDRCDAPVTRPRSGLTAQSPYIDGVARFNFDTYPRIAAIVVFARVYRQSFAARWRWGILLGILSYLGVTILCRTLPMWTSGFSVDRFWMKELPPKWRKLFDGSMPERASGQTGYRGDRWFATIINCTVERQSVVSDVMFKETGFPLRDARLVYFTSSPMPTQLRGTLTILETNDGALLAGLDVLPFRKGMAQSRMPVVPKPLGTLANLAVCCVLGLHIIILPHAVRAWWRLRHGLCHACGYDLKALPLCPECGAPAEHQVSH